MAPSPGIQATWQRLKRSPGRAPLRIKLIAAVLALVTVALLVISLAGTIVLRGYLLGQVDRQYLQVNELGGVYQLVRQYLTWGQQTIENGFSIQWLPRSGTAHTVLYETRATPDGQPGPPVSGPAVRNGDSWLQSGLNPVTVTSAGGSSSWRVISFPETYDVNGQGLVSGTVIVGYDVTSIYHTIDELTLIDLIISIMLLIVVGVLGIALIRSSLRPLTDIERTAEAIAAGDLSRRIPENNPDTEVGRLGRSLNLMLSHIETSFRARAASEAAARRSEEAARHSAIVASRSEDRMRRFVADASHELRTPLTAIRGYAEYYRQRGGFVTGRNPARAKVGATDVAGPEFHPGAAGDGLSGAELDHLIHRVEQEAKRMGVLVDDLLLLARLDQQRPLDFRTVDMLAIGADALNDARVISPGRTINLTVTSPQAALVVGDEVGLRQVVGNLMSNAMTHTPDGTPIDITIRVGELANGRAPEPSGPAVILEVKDHGPGLTREQQEHVFERFYRTDRARSRTAGGTGLGLAIVAAMIDAHHGKVWVDSQPGAGASFGFALPLAPEARHAHDDEADNTDEDAKG
jgi:two-component system OmpR family sensor kinase